jgi:hypothetical protein
MTDMAGPGQARFAVVPRALALYLGRCRRRSRFYAGETTADLPVGGPWQSEDLEIPRCWNPRHLDREDLWDPEVLVAETLGCQAITTPAGLHVELTILAGDGPACDAAYTWQVLARGVPFALIAPNPWRLKNLGNGTVGAAAAAAIVYDAADQANDLIGGYQVITGQPFTARDAPESPAAS